MGRELMSPRPFHAKIKKNYDLGHYGGRVLTSAGNRGEASLPEPTQTVSLCGSVNRTERFGLFPFENRRNALYLEYERNRNENH